MKKNTVYIAIIRDAAGNQINFERFACHKAETAKRRMKWLFNSELYRVCNKTAARVEIYATPDGYSRNEKPEIVFDI